MSIIRKTELARNTSLARSGALPPTSRKRRKEQREQVKVYAEVDADRKRYCACCGTPHNLEHSHILTQKKWPAHRNNPINFLDLCHEHHSLWENHKEEFAIQFPEVYGEKLRRMELLDPQALAFFLLKHPAPTPYG